MTKRLAGVCAVLLASGAQAAVVLDQSALHRAPTPPLPAQTGALVTVIGNVPPRAGTTGPATQQAAFQTFTAGQAGVLDHLLFQGGQFNSAASNGALLMTLIRGDALAGANEVWWQQLTPFAALDPNFSNGWRAGTASIRFDVSGAGLRLAAGDRYSVRFDGLTSEPSQRIGLLLGTGAVVNGVPTFTSSGYEGGTYRQIVDGVEGPERGWDIGFESYIDTAGAVPEPASWMLMIGGLGAVGASLRRRRGVSARGAG